MKKRITDLLTFVLFVSLVSCVPYSTVSSLPPDGISRSRTIVIDGIKISEEDVGGYVSWACHDFITPEEVLVEVGFFVDTVYEAMGFVLYDGGNSGTKAVYMREGLEHNWYWGESVNYAFVIRTDGVGAYYDFSDVPRGEETKPKEIYKCKKR